MVLTPKRIIRVSAILSLLLIAVGLWWWIGPADRGRLSGFLLTADQQAQRLYQAGDHAAAAARFHDLAWQAAAWYRAGEFKQAAGLYAGIGSPEAAYNQGNALLMQGKYEAAVAQYDAALEQRPGWQDARINRDIAFHRAKRAEQKGAEGGTEVGADEIRFDANKPPQGDKTEQTGEEQALGDAEIRELWLRRVQTQPADFLRARFAYQSFQQGQEAGR